MKENTTAEAVMDIPDFVKTETLALKAATIEKHGEKGIIAGAKMLETLQVVDAACMALGENSDEICLIMELLAKQLDIHARRLRFHLDARRTPGK